jgi:hypothetical protein
LISGGKVSVTSAMRNRCGMAPMLAAPHRQRDDVPAAASRRPRDHTVIVA